MNRQYVVALSVALVLSVLYTNCGSKHAQLGFGSQGSAVCDAALLDVFAKGYHPHFKKQCASCHATGPGMGTFAEKTAASAYASFMSMGPDRVHDRALDDGHNVPYTGQAHASTLGPIQSQWNTAYAKYEACVASTGGGTTVVLSEIPFAKSTTADWTLLEWDLAADGSSEALSGTFSIEVRSDESNVDFPRYEFRNPVISLDDLSKGWSLEALWLTTNSQRIESLTTYSNLNSVIVAAPAELAPDAGTGYYFTPVSPSINIGVHLIGLVQDGSTAGGGGGGGGGGSGSSSGITYDKLIASNGVFGQNCVACHNNNRSDGGLNLQNYNALVANYIIPGNAAGSELYQRMNDAGDPMPTTGLLQQSLRDQIRTWINEGAER